jgi:hypothetical protein
MICLRKPSKKAADENSVYFDFHPSSEQRHFSTHPVKLVKFNPAGIQPKLCSYETLHNVYDFDDLPKGSLLNVQ